MKIQPALVLVVLLFLPGVHVGQTSLSTAPSDNYEILLATLKAGDTKIDFTALRFAYSRSKSADPYGADHDKRWLMNAAVIQNRCDEATKIADALLASIYLSPDTHAAKSACYRLAGDNKRAEFHKAIYLGLINSILTKGDGNSLETAYAVVTIEEEYAVMRALGYSVWGQRYESKAGHTVNILSGSVDKNKQTVQVYFNVDIPFAIEKQRNAPKQ